MTRRSAPGSIRSMVNDPRPGGGGERRADRSMASANDPRVSSGRPSTAARARATDPPVRSSGNRGGNLGKYLHPAKGKR